jgi:hypothetical protein
MSDAPYPLKEVLKSLQTTLREAESLSGYLQDVYPFYANQIANPEQGKVVIHLGVEASQSDIELLDANFSQTIETAIVMLVDTVLSQDADTFDPAAANGLLDYEWRVFQALHAVESLGTPYCLVWRVEGVERDVPIVDPGSGEVDSATPIRRLQITLRVKHRIW